MFLFCDSIIHLGIAHFLAFICINLAEKCYCSYPLPCESPKITLIVWFKPSTDRLVLNFFFAILYIYFPWSSSKGLGDYEWEPFTCATSVYCPVAMTNVIMFCSVLCARVAIRLFPRQNCSAFRRRLR